MEYHGILDDRGPAWISVETQGSGTALECLRYDGEAAWYDGGMTETGVAGGPLGSLGSLGPRGSQESRRCGHPVTQELHVSLK